MTTFYAFVNVFFFQSPKDRAKLPGHREVPKISLTLIVDTSVLIRSRIVANCQSTELLRDVNLRISLARALRSMHLCNCALLHSNCFSGSPFSFTLSFRFPGCRFYPSTQSSLSFIYHSLTSYHGGTWTEERRARHDSGRDFEPKFQPGARQYASSTNWKEATSQGT